MKILLVLPPGLAEIVSSTPLIRCLKKQMAGVELHVLVDGYFAFALQANSFIDHLHAAAKAHTVFAANSFDVLIDLAVLEENQQWASASGVRYLSLHRAGFVSRLMALMGRGNAAHLAEQYLSVVQPLGVRYDGNGLDYFVPQAEIVKPHDIPIAHSAGFIALVLDPGLAPPFAVLQAFCKLIDHPLMLIGPLEVAGVAGRLCQVDPVKVYSACGKFSMNESADLLRRAKLVAAPENAWMLLAAALKKPLVVMRSSKRYSALFPPFYPQQMLQAMPRPYRQIPVPLKQLEAKDKTLRKTDAVAVGALIEAVREML